MIEILPLYTYILAGLATIFLLKRYLLITLRFILHPSGRLHDFTMSRFVLPFIIRRRRLCGPITGFQALMYLGYIAGTIACNLIGVDDLSTARSRAGSLGILHITGLALLPQFSIGAAIFNISLRSYRQLHIIFGIMGTFQSLLHIFLALRTTKFNLGLFSQRYGFSAIISMAVVSLMAFPWIRHRTYEFCLRLHISLGLFSLVALWFHLQKRFGIDGYFLIGGVGSFSIIATGQLIYQIFRNRKNGKGLAVAERTELPGAIQLKFTPTRSWSVHAGQYVYLRVPAVSHFAFAESHPFNILWWEENDTDGQLGSITILAKVESGFTRRLAYCSHNSLRVIVDGPYGKTRETGHYDSFVFVSTGIGITAQLSYLKDLLTRRQRGYRLRRVCLIWQVEDKAHDDWICSHMNYLLDLDEAELVLRWALYINSTPPEEETQELKPTGFIGRRGNRFFGKPDLQSIIKFEVARCPAKLLLTVSGDSETRDTCRYIAIKEKKKIDFFETDFQPTERAGGFWAPKVATHEVSQRLWAPKAPPKCTV